LLFCAIETKAYTRCPPLFDQLKASGSPSQKDYWNMVRYGAVQGGWQQMLRIVQEIREQGLEVNSFIFNTVLASCVSANEIGEARKLLTEMSSTSGCVDVITYNTLIKGYSKRGDLDSCFELFSEMRSNDLKPSQVTYGILLDGCINNNQVQKASEVFDMIKGEGCPMNTVLYTTLIKGLLLEQKVDEAMRVFGHLLKEKDIKPDLITFSIVLRGNCEAGRLEAGLELLDVMLRMGIKPDEVIFNVLLSGCAKQGNADLARRLYSNMEESGSRPSTATFSILIRLFSDCKLLDEAVHMLRTEPQKYKMEVEPRLFCQLIQACIRQRKGGQAIDVYKLMYEHCVPCTVVHNSVLNRCIKLNMFETAGDMLALAADRGGRVAACDANLVLEGALRKKKHSVVEACIASMKSLGLQVDDRLM